MKMPDYQRDYSSDFSRVRSDMDSLERRVRGEIKDLRKDLKSYLCNVNSSIANLSDMIGSISEMLQAMHQIQTFQNRLNQAETRLVRLRQELEKKYAVYDTVRRTAIGLLQGADIEVIRSCSIKNKADEMMITVPHYWLAACTSALAAWLNDNRKVANNAMKEALRRDRVKTSLFFALLCRRANKPYASQQWTRRYFEYQTPESMNRETLLMLDAFASGLLGANTSLIIMNTMYAWRSSCAGDIHFVSKQVGNWSSIFKSLKGRSHQRNYPLLSTCSPSWNVIDTALGNSELPERILNLFDSLFVKQAVVSGRSMREQLDDTLENLVSNFDEGERDAKDKAKFEQYVIDCGGNEKAAQKRFDTQPADEEHFSFAELLLCAVIPMEHISIMCQRWATAMSKEWIQKAYMDVKADYESEVPSLVQIQVQDLVMPVAGNTDTDSLCGRLSEHLDELQNEEIAKCRDDISSYIAVMVILALVLLATVCFIVSSGSLSLVSAGIAAALIFGMRATVSQINAYKENNQRRREKIKEDTVVKKREGRGQIEKLLAEIKQFRAELDASEDGYRKLNEFFSQVTPERIPYFVKNEEAAQN